MINFFDIEETGYDLNKKIADLTIVIFLLIKQDDEYVNLSDKSIKDTINKSVNKLYYEAGITEENSNNSDMVRRIEMNNFPTLTSYILLLKNEIETIDIKEKIYYQYIFERLKDVTIFDGKTDLRVYVDKTN